MGLPKFFVAFSGRGGNRGLSWRPRRFVSADHFFVNINLNFIRVVPWPAPPYGSASAVSPLDYFCTNLFMEFFWKGFKNWQNLETLAKFCEFRKFSKYSKNNKYLSRNFFFLQRHIWYICRNQTLNATNKSALSKAGEKIFFTPRRSKMGSTLNNFLIVQKMNFEWNYVINMFLFGTHQLETFHRSLFAVGRKQWGQFHSKFISAQLKKLFKVLPIFDLLGAV